MFNETQKPVVAHRIEESSDVGVYNPAHLRANNPESECIQRIVLAASRSKPVRKAEKVLLVGRDEP
jgi:hypothetical protein